MFGRKNPIVIMPPARGSDTHHHHTTINQPPADAADSARLYGELLEKARAEVTHAVASQIGSINATVVTFNMMRAPMDFKDRIGVIFKVNGKEFRVLVERHLDEEKTAEAIYTAVAEKITQALANDMLKTIYRETRFT